MHFTLSQTFVLGLLASGQLVAAFQPDVAARDLEDRFVGSPASLASRYVKVSAPLNARHHTEAQIAAKEAAAAKGDSQKNATAKADHKKAEKAAKEAAAKGNSQKNATAKADHKKAEKAAKEAEKEKNALNDKREPHHTEAQIAAKEAAQKKKTSNGKREAHHTEAQIAAKEAAASKKNGKTGKREAEPQEADEFGPWDSTEDEFGSWVDKREAHHTEAQIAAKEAAQKKKTSNGKREPHHTEAQIAAKEAAAAKKNAKSGKREAEPQEADEFGPWDSTEDEFGSWVDKREAHHTEAQIAAKEAAASKKNGKTGKREASPQEADEFGPWDSTEDEFGSWVDKREAHHTEAQIAAKEAAAAKKTGKNGKREASPQEADEFGPWDSTEDEFGSWVDKREAHHTEAQIAAKEAAKKKANTAAN